MEMDDFIWCGDCLHLKGTHDKDGVCQGSISCDEEGGYIDCCSCPCRGFEPDETE